MERNNKIMLITYADSMGKDLKELRRILDAHFAGAVGGVHILPFFPSSGDRGFSPMTYRQVDPAFGSFADVQALAENYYLMFDYMINHISRQSEYFKDFEQNHDGSPYRDLFLRYKDFWPGGFPTQEQVDLIYKRKPRAPYIDVTFGDGQTEKVWCTFSEEQIDLNVKSPTTQRFNRENLQFLAEHGAAILRLDAFAYATKRMDTNCFFVEPDVWELLDECAETLRPYGAQILPEMHEHYSIQLKLAEHGYAVYDFALPMLVLHAIYSGTAKRLRHWLQICPRNQYTTLDTHDGIGVVDVKDLLTDEEIEFTREALYAKGANAKKIYSSEAYNNLDIYQINCTYYSALGDRDDAYLLARAIQFFTPGVPQVYYVGLLAGKNDIDLLERTKEGRNINRHYYTPEEVSRELARPVVQKLLALMRFRNDCPAFSGQISLPEREDHLLCVRWENGGSQAELTADLQSCAFTITTREGSNPPQVLEL